MLRILPLLCFFLGTPTAQADILQGRVLDAETREPLEGAKVSIEEVIPDVCTISQVLQTDSLGCFQYRCSDMTRITIRADFFGYKQGSVRLVGSDGGDTIRISDLLLKPSEVLLEEVKVTARQRRFYMRGDTVVFNPEAFQLEDGDRLLDLVQQLPGVSIKDGRLLWNGEPLKMMMNGHEALSEELLLKRLPVEAVADVKAYERKSEQEERTGVADGNQEQVLDVRIKPGFMDNWYGSAEATAYTGKNYGTQFDGMRLSDSDPVMLFARVGDEPRMEMVHTMGSFGREEGGTPVRQQMGAAGYKHAWRPSFKVKRENYLTLSASASHTDRPQSSWENTRTFLPGTTPTQTDSQRESYEHQFKVPLDFSAFLNLTPKNTLFLTAHADYGQSETSNSTEEQTHENGVAINTRQHRSQDCSRGLTVSAEAQLTHYIPKGAMGVKANVSYSDKKAHGNSLGEYHYLQTATLATDSQSYESPHRHLAAAMQLALSHAFTKQAMFHANWQTAFDHNFRDEQRWRNSTADANNSFRRTDSQWQNELKTDATLTLRKLTLKPVLSVAILSQHTAYRRAALDTVARRSLLLLLPSLELTYRIRKQMSLKVHLAYDEHPADLMDCIAYTDDTNPLFVYEGNPNLTTGSTLNAGLRYNFMLARGSQAFGISVNYAKTYDPIGTVLHYNSLTGGYRAQKQNVRGGSSWGGELSYDRSLGKHLQLQNTLSENWNASYGILTVVDEQAGLSYNRQQSLFLRERLGLIYEAEGLTVSSFHDFNWERYAYSDAAQETENVFRYATQLKVRYHYRQWTFALDPHFYLNRGYRSDAMNNNLFVLNAEVSCKFLKNRASLILAARDLLNKETDYTSAITATTNTESGKSYLHHFVTLTFRYKLERKK